MIKKFINPTCPYCRLKVESENINKLHETDMVITKCINCKKRFYYIKSEEGYISFSDYYEYFTYISKK